MSSKRLNVSNYYNGLEEAVIAVLEDSDSEADYEFAIIPPEPSIVTDEEEGADEAMITASLPRDVPGNIEVFRSNKDTIPCGDLDSSDDEPLAEKAKRSRRQQPDQPVWRTCSPTYSTTTQERTEVIARQTLVKEQFQNLTPVQIFEKIFDDEVISLIITNTILYANQNNRHTFQLDSVDLKKFIGILILSGYHKLPREDLYWSYDEDVGVEMVSRSMPRQRFRDIKKNLHFVNNDEASNTRDKMFKIRPLADILINKFLQWGVMHDNISIDESMVKYFGHHPAKQFIRGKPVRFGYKNWVAASSTGYCYVFDLYCGKAIEASTDPLGSRVVKMLLQKLGTDPTNHQVFFDNFFTNYNLLVDLKKEGYRATGTIRENRTKKCPLKSTKEMKKKDRASYDYRFDKQNEILLVRWKDNSVCTIATNYDTIEPLGVVKRWSPVQRQKTDVNIPKLFQTYNKNMGGVDELDQSISLYRIAIHGKKWWWVLFTYMVDMAIANAWRLHVISHSDSMDQLLFRRTIARYYLRQKTQHKARSSSSLVPGLPQDGIGHYPQKLGKPLRCVICHARVRWQCKKCLKTLCVEKQCFENFHL
nr:piggyBac transposable element-derived protein 2-like [Vanessa tameamea]